MRLDAFKLSLLNGSSVNQKLLFPKFRNLDLFYNYYRNKLCRTGKMADVNIGNEKAIPLSVSVGGSEVPLSEQRVYTLSKKIGKGSYSTVHLAEYRNGERREKLACKVFDRNLAPKDFLASFFPRELAILSCIKHPHIIGFHSIVLEQGPKVFICMRHAENGNLLDFILLNGTLPENQARIWLLQLVRALQYLHHNNIVHRDLKCDNVLLSQHWNVKLADFGFARYCVDASGT